MARIRQQRPSPGLFVAVIALVVALGGLAVALPGKNNVDKNDLKKGAVTKKAIKKGAVTKKAIKKNAVTAKAIKQGAVRSKQVRDDSLTGADINESTLGEVPNAATARNLVGHKPFFIKLSFGQSQVIDQHGTVSLTAVCDQTGGDDRIRIIAATTQDGAILKSGGADNLLGPGSGAPGAFLNVGTPEDDREFVNVSDTSGETTAFFRLDGGYVVGPDGKMISLEEEGLLLAINYLGSNCVLAGITDQHG